jgi:hypothetical protein
VTLVLLLSDSSAIAWTIVDVAVEKRDYKIDYLNLNRNNVFYVSLLKTAIVKRAPT